MHGRALRIRSQQSAAARLLPKRCDRTNAPPACHDVPIYRAVADCIATSALSSSPSSLNLRAMPKAKGDRFAVAIAQLENDADEAHRRVMKDALISTARLR
jgi:hypothetical protein